MGDKTMNKECVFRQKDTAQIYYPGEIKAYCIINNKLFVSRNMNGKDVFLEYLIHGILNVYYLRDDTGEHYYVEKDGLGMEELIYSEKYVKKGDGTEYLEKSNDHIRILNKYTSDVPDMVKFQKEIKKIIRPGHGNLIKIAKKYHEEVCPDDACTIFRQKSKVRIDLELLGGAANYKSLIFDNEQPFGGTNFMTGLYAYIWLQRESDSFFFKTGVALSPQKEWDWNNVQSDLNYTYAREGKNKLYHKIPFFMEYMYSKYNIQPRIGLGLNLHQFKYTAIGSNVGVNIKLYEKIYLSLNYEIDWTIRSFPNKLCTQSFYGGIRYSL